MCPDDRAEQRLDLGARAEPYGQLAQRLKAVRRVRVRDPDLERRSVAAARLERMLELEKGVVRTPTCFERDDLPSIPRIGLMRKARPIKWKVTYESCLLRQVLGWRSEVDPRHSRM